MQCVEDDRRPYAYTIGLHDRGCRNCGDRLSPAACHRLLNVGGRVIAVAAVVNARPADRDRGRAAHRNRRGRPSRRAPEVRGGVRRPRCAGAAVGVGRRPRPLAVGGGLGSRPAPAARARCVRALRTRSGGTAPCSAGRAPASSPAASPGSTTHVREDVVVERRHPCQQPHPRHRLDDVVGSVDPPVQRRSRTPHHRVGPLRFDAQPVERVELQLAGREACSTTRRSSAMPSSSVRYMVRPSPIISVGRSRGISANQPGSVTEAAMTW